MPIGAYRIQLNSVCLRSIIRGSGKACSARARIGGVTLGQATVTAEIEERIVEPTSRRIGIVRTVPILRVSISVVQQVFCVA